MRYPLPYNAGMNLNKERTFVMTGRNDNPGTSAFEELWEVGGAYNWLSSASSLEVLSSSVNDDMTTGTHAWKVRVAGLDENWEEVTQVVELDGTSVVALSGSWSRINDFAVIQVGTYGNQNDGNITLRVASAGVTVGYITAGEGKEQQCVYTVPAGCVAMVVGGQLSEESTKTANFTIEVRRNINGFSAPYAPFLLVREFDGVEGMHAIPNAAPVNIPEKTDLRIRVKAAAANSAASGTLQMIVVPA
jgi:hypothetical protein